jgi:hypothetical protein
MAPIFPAVSDAHMPLYGTFVKPACAKCLSKAKAVLMLNLCITTKEMQSVSE